VDRTIRDKNTERDLDVAGSTEGSGAIHHREVCPDTTRTFNRFNNPFSTEEALLKVEITIKKILLMKDL
jgi:hypothetical protein